MNWQEKSEFPQDPASDSAVIIKVSPQSPETLDTETTFHTLPKTHPLWTEGSVGSARQLIEGRKPTFTTCLLQRTCSLFSIFHPEHLIRDRHPTLQERRNSFQNDSLDCLPYIVDLHFRSLVKLRQESPLLYCRGPSRKEQSPVPPKTLHYISNSLNRSLIHTNLHIFPTKLGETQIQNTHQLTLKVLIPSVA